MSRNLSQNKINSKYSGKDKEPTSPNNNLNIVYSYNHSNHLINDNQKKIKQLLPINNKKVEIEQIKEERKSE
jgi:hypothetical protein